VTNGYIHVIGGVVVPDLVLQAAEPVVSSVCLTDDPTSAATPTGA
jgi:hypothetical protein